MKTKTKWLMLCSNLDCLFASEKESGEPDYICNRCGSTVEVNEKIIIIEEDSKE